MSEDGAVAAGGAVLVIGEALVDVVRRADGSVDEHPGGSPANVAVGLARLGRETHLLTRVGDDERGAAVRAHLEASGVHLVPGTVQPGATSVAQAQLAPDQQRELTHVGYELLTQLLPYALREAAADVDVSERLATRAVAAFLAGLHFEDSPAPAHAIIVRC